MSHLHPSTPSNAAALDPRRWPADQAPARGHDLGRRVPDPHRCSTSRSATGYRRTPTVLRTFVLATVAVPIVIYGVMPRLHRVRARILTRGARTKRM